MNEHPFKFKTFAERVGEVDLRKTALYFIENENQEHDAEDTYFCQAIRKWSTLNLTDEYINFHKRVQDIITLPQLLHRKDYVVDLLLKSLDTATTFSLQPLLEFIVVLSKDLREDFYGYFEKFFDKLLLLLDTKDADQLEYTLVCLAFLFKSLKSFLKKDISVIFHKIFPLLEDIQPVHITNFAAECFAFIARDIKDKEKFIVFVLQAVKGNDNAVVGTGRLFFEMIRGVNGQFHSCAESFYTSLLQCMYNSQIPGELLFQVLIQTICDMLQCIHQKYIHPFWTISYKFLDNTLDNKGIELKQLNLNINYVLQLLGQAIEYLDGKYVEDVKSLIKMILKILDNPNINDQNLMIISQLTSIILTNQSLQVTQLDATRLIKKNLNTDSKNVFEDFISNMIEYANFDLLVLPDFLKYMETHFNDETILLLSEIITAKSPICKTGIEIANWKKYPIALKGEDTKQKIIKRMLTFKIDEVIENPKIFLLHVVSFQHYENLEKDKVLDFLHEFAYKVCGKITASKETADTDEKYKSNQKLFTLLSVLVEVLINSNYEKLNIIRVVETVLLYSQNEKYLPALRVLDMCLTQYNEKTQNDPSKLFHNIQFNLSENLISPFQEVRLLTSHIFSLFHQFKIRLHDEENDETTLTSIYDIMYKNESIEPTVATYREKIILLQRLMCDSPHHRAVHDKSCELDALKYLFSVFYVNFKLLWEPATQIIKTYEATVSMVEFWPIVKTQIDDTTKRLNANSEEEIRSIIVEGITEDDWHNADKVDYVNYRIMLFSTILALPTLILSKVRELIISFMGFLKNEYNAVQKNKNTISNLNEIDENLVQLDTERLDDDIEGVKSLLTPKSTHKMLILYLKIFAKLTHPRTGYYQNELYQIYVNFLSHRSLEVQKLAFDCIVNYRLKYVTPYKQNIYNLIDEKTFKNELLNFKIARQDQYILDEHRTLVIPLIMKILFTKMVTKYGANSDKSSFLARKQSVLRFIGKCEECEIFTFTNTAFKLFLDIIRSPLNIRDCLLQKSNVKFSHIPPNIIQSILGLIDLIKDHFAGTLSENFHRYMLHLLICGGFVIKKATDLPESVQKTLRSLCLNSIVNFFAHFDRFIWKEEEIDIIFDIFVWPQLFKLTDAIHTPTPLLKLFIEWSKNPRYYILLAKHHVCDVTFTPLPYIIQLLKGESTSLAVSEAIMEMIGNMLMYAENDKGDGNDTQSINLRSNIVPIKQQLIDQMKLSEPLNLGSSILLPYIQDILDVLQQYLNRKSKVLSKRNLFILSRVTELVNNESTSNTLISLLIPICLKKVKSKGAKDIENLTQMFTTMHNLIQRIESSDVYIRQIAPFFEFIVEVNLRKLLCQILSSICAKYDDIYKDTADIVSEMNALHRRWIEQPDYERRIDAFKRIEKLTASRELNIELGILFIHHCLFFSKYEKDLAISDLCTTQLRSVCIVLTEKYQNDTNEIDYIFNKLILSSIQRSIKTNNEKNRNDCLLLLGELSRECPQVNEVFLDLNALTSKVNREVDFFDNITHLQLYRHTKALSRFNKLVERSTCAIKPRTLMNFILPIADSYLCNEKYLKKANILAAATECIGALCSLLSWQNYLTVLRHYLGKLRRDIVHQKQLIKIVSSILDAFHFDMSQASIFKLKELVAIKDDDIDETTVPDMEDKPEDGNEDIDANILPIIEADVQTTALLSENDSNKLIAEISQKIIPDLFRIVNEKTSYDSALKINQQKERAAKEKEDMLRIPIAVAIVKLLQKLPTVMLDKHLPRLIIKISTFLKSSMKSVRVTTRDTLKSIMLSLGTNHLEMVLRHLKSILLKGFQVHVLSVTYFTLIDALKNEFKTGDIDKIMQIVLNVCIEDIFGKSGEEKEIEDVARGTPEANPSKKSFLTINILASNITEPCILDLILPFKTILNQTNSKKKVMKVQECLQKINAGLTSNTNLSMESLLYFIYGTTSESIPDLIPEALKTSRSPNNKSGVVDKPDIFIIPVEPSRRSAIKQNSQINSQANSHVLVEFGLELLDIILKRQKLMDMDYEPYLTPLVKILINSLVSSYARVTSFAIKCLTSIWSTKLTLKEVEENVDEIVKSIFTVLHKYATVGGTSRNNDNFILVKNCFKCVVTLLRYCKYYTVSTDQLKILLLYVEQDMHNSDRQIMAFTLLKSIVGRKLTSPKIHEIMQTLSETIVTSESTVARNESRAILLMYMMEYPLGKKLQNFIKFFIKQLEYDVIAGRQSVIQMFSLMLHKFPIRIVEKNSDLLFLSFAARLVNDDEPECKVMIAECLETIISRMNKTVRDQLFNLIGVYLEDKQLVHREMAAQLCIRFVEVEKEEFSKRFKTILPDLLVALLNFNSNGPGRFVRAPEMDFDSDDDEDDEDEHMNDGEDSNNENDNMNDENLDLSFEAPNPKRDKLLRKQKQKDHCLIQILNIYIKILDTCPDFLSNIKYNNQIDEISYMCQSFLAYEHAWVRLLASKILDKVLSTLDFDLLQNSLLDNSIQSSARQYLYRDPERELKSLALDLCAQLQPNETDEELATQVITNILYITNIIKVIPIDEENDHNSKTFNLLWLIRRMRYVVHAEITKAGNSIILRKNVYKWIEAVITLLEPEMVHKLATSLLSPIIREMGEGEHINEALKEIAVNIGNQLKTLIGDDKYNKIRLELQSKLQSNRIQRKQNIAREKVRNPIVAAKRKFAIQFKKKEARKRKQEDIREGILPKKKKKRMEDLFR